jgi:hypothetical protein
MPLREPGRYAGVHLRMNQNSRPKDHPAPPRREEMFCIHSYAGEMGPPCGWRGPVVEATHCVTTGTRRCPRCGRATLLEIPPPAG